MWIRKTIFEKEINGETELSVIYLGQDISPNILFTYKLLNHTYRDHPSKWIRIYI